MKKIGIIIRAPANPVHHFSNPVRHFTNPAHDLRPPVHHQGGPGHAPFAVHMVQVMSTVATVITALAAFIACAATMNITTVSVLAAACVLAGWLARDRRARHHPILLNQDEPETQVGSEGLLERLWRRYLT
ncbi:hypothetical protein [Nocardia sp. NPDC052566]|uniref:hypothetical protein n=1 Tax=Nocardia sp. NPDC052566 TaxID=3364330 RepID=UPI0037C5688B